MNTSDTSLLDSSKSVTFKELVATLFKGYTRDVLNPCFVRKCDLDHIIIDEVTDDDVSDWFKDN